MRSKDRLRSTVYRANTPWSPAAAIAAVALIVSVQLMLPLVVYGLSPELYQVISGETGQPKIWPQSGSPTLGLLQQIVAGCLVWFAAGLGNGTRRAVLSLPPLKGGAYTYVALALLVFSIMVLQVTVAKFSVSSPQFDGSHPVNHRIESYLALDERTGRADSNSIG